MQFTVLILNFPEVPNSIKWAGTIFGILVAIIGTWKFVVQRPRLALTAEVDTVNRINEQVVINPEFFIENKGLSHAKDVYLEITLDDWNFDSDEGINFSSSPLEVEHEKLTYIGAPGEINQIFIERILHGGSKFKLFWGKVRLQPGRKYNLNYSVSCQTYGPREGTLTLEAGFNSVEIKNKTPRFWMAWWTKFRDRISLDLPRLKFLYKKVNINSGESDDSYRVEPDALIQVYSDLRIGNAILKIYHGEAKLENIIGDIQIIGSTLKAGELWEPTERNPYIELNKDEFPPDDLRFKWDLDSSLDERGNVFGVDVLEITLLPEDDSSAGHRPVSAEFQIENKNITEETVSAITKFYDNEDVLLTTNHERISVPSKSIEDVRINANLDIKDEKRIDDVSVVIKRNL